jgi:hypothetical protein
MGKFSISKSTLSNVLSGTLGRRIGYSVSGGFLSRHGQDNTVDHYVKEKYLSKKCRNKLPIYSGITPEGACAYPSPPPAQPTAIRRGTVTAIKKIRSITTSTNTISGLVEWIKGRIK